MRGSLLRQPALPYWNREQHLDMQLYAERRLNDEDWRWKGLDERRCQEGSVDHRQHHVNGGISIKEKKDDRSVLGNGRKNVESAGYAKQGTGYANQGSNLKSALNVVSFGNFRVRARVASFDRNDKVAGKGLEMEMVGPVKEREGERSESYKGVEVRKVTTKMKAKNGDDRLDNTVKGGPGSPADVRVGDIVVQIRASKESEERAKVQEKAVEPTPRILSASDESAKGKHCRVYMRNYRTKSDDVKWVQNGIVATITNGEVFPVIQSRLTDTGFDDLVLIPMGADKVFVRSLTGEDALSAVNNATNFFQLVFSNWMRWENNMIPYQRGAWVRLFGIPLHAWNVEFFKLCVLECGRFMSVDSSSADKDRLDFARVLIATPDLEIINRVEQVLVDGTLVEIKIVEEWGDALGGDICLFENESKPEAYQSDRDEGQGDPETHRNVETLIEKFAEGLDEEDDIGSQENYQFSDNRGRVDCVLGLRDSPHVSEAQDSPSICSPGDGIRQHVESGGREGSPPTFCRNKRTKSCLPVERSMISGSWSLEWLHDLNQRDVGVIFSSRKKPRKGGRAGKGLKKAEQEVPKKKKAGGVFWHTLSSLKKVARLPSKERGEVLKVLKKNEHGCRDGSGAPRACRGSQEISSDVSLTSVSANNDWKRWVVMQGSDQVVMEDVREVGQAIGVKLQRNNENMFSALSREGKEKKTASGQTQGGGVFDEDCLLECEGSGGFEKRQEVCKLVGNQKPLVICIQETKLQLCEAFICSSLWGNAPHAFSYRPSVGASGGLLTLWDSTEVEVWSSESRDHVLWCHGRFIKSGEEFSVANVYAPCDLGAKQELWNSLSMRLQTLGRARVCVCGDFNVVRSIEERLSDRDGDRSLDHVAFNRFIDDNTLIDLPLCGPRMRGLSDHCPLVLFANEEDCGPRPSRMLKCWKDVPGYNLFVREKWNSFQVDGWGGFVLKEKFKMIKLALKDWNTTHTQNLPSRIESLKERLAALDDKGGEEGLSETELAGLHGVTSNIHSLSGLHASINWQQSHSRWLKEGDANTKYFHPVLASRRRGNDISSLQVGSNIVEGVASIRHAVVMHFTSHFETVSVVRPGVDNLIFKRLPQAEGSSLIKLFLMEEVKAAVWDCDSYKSPGPDGINFGSIKDFWDLVKGDVMRFILEFHRNCRLTKGLNATFIALIPKVDSPQQLNDFRPISLVGSLYKILAKVLANRLRLVMGSVISESQTAFVKDRQIMDGILIANEAVDEARRSKKELILFKVDFEKAYDFVDWGYLDAVMGRMGFPTLWRKWIRECVSTEAASVLVNGSPTGEFPLKRGLRQGDLLSPFLFLLAGEGLHVLMEAMVERNLFTGYRVGELAPVSVSHLQFVDDTLLMGTKSWANFRALRAVLVLFETMSGLKVNFNK
ncbi:cysteine-rich receptor-like protein kinase, partial [Trifolium medium]|nr:cysteine-rich receptor-like protein kinase [Trifolium medium]